MLWKIGKWKEWRGRSKKMKWSEVTFMFFQRFATMMIPKENRKVSAQIIITHLTVTIRVSDPLFLPGSGSGFQISMEPDPVSEPGSGSGS